MGTPAFPNLGEHCDFSECNLIDFLPFSCDRCEKVFCLDHRSYVSHDCPKGNVHDVTVLVCPMCAKSVRLVPGEDPNITWDRHVKTSCDPRNYAKVEKPRCPVPMCKEMLTISNKFQCKSCRREVCMKHRFGLDHNCASFINADRAKSWYNFSSRSSQGARSSQPATSSWSSAFSSIKSSAEAGLSKLSLSADELVKSVKGSASKVQNQYLSSSGRNVSSAAEICPQCKAQFRTVGELIEHVETSHSRRPVQPC